MPRGFTANRAEYRNRSLAAGDFVGLVREMEGEAMSAKRHYWSKMNHSEARAVTEIMTDEEAGRWLRGWLAGALGEDGQVDVKPMEWKMGFSAGKASFQDAQEFSRKQSERVSKRYTESTAVDSGSDFDTEATVEPSGIPELPITNKQTNKQDKNKEHRPPSREEWNARASENFPWWPRWDVDKAFAYWSAEDFTREGKRTRSDWRRLMGTWAGKWADEHRDEVARHSAPAIQGGWNRLPSGFRPLGKAPEV